MSILSNLFKLINDLLGCNATNKDDLASNNNEPVDINNIKGEEEVKEEVLEEVKESDPEVEVEEFKESDPDIEVSEQNNNDLNDDINEEYSKLSRRSSLVDPPKLIEENDD